MSEQKVELMYRQPGVDTHQNITDVLDEIILELRGSKDREVQNYRTITDVLDKITLKLREFETRIAKLEEKD